MEKGKKQEAADQFDPAINLLKNEWWNSLQPSARLRLLLSKWDKPKKKQVKKLN